MFIGTCEIENGLVKVSKTTYVITKETRPDVRLIFKAPALIVAAGLSVFGIGFSDLLYPSEIFAISACVFISLLAGFQIARLVILDRVTRGTEQANAVYGLHYAFQEKRAEIDVAIDQLKGELS